MRILMIDDSSVDVHLASEQIRASLPDVSITVVRDGASAAQQIRAQQADCILLDLGLPGVSGLEILLEVKSGPDAIDTPIVVLTGDHRQDSAVTAMKSGAADYFFKDKMLIAGLLAACVSDAVHAARAKLAAEDERAELLRLSRTDDLTGLGNRRAFFESLDRTIARAERLNHEFDLMCLDLNEFKPINDQHGHLVGDLVLKTVALRLEEASRAHDECFRLGGDEFAVIAQTDPRERRGTVFLARRIVAALNRSMAWPDGAIAGVGVSIGIARWPRDCRDAEQLYARADNAMYAAKRRGEGSMAYCADENQTSIEFLRAQVA